jgi:hypothetical protein
MKNNQENSIVCIGEGNALMDENYKWRGHHRAVWKLRAAGYVEMPRWFPSGGWREDFYDYKIIGGVEVLMKPKPDFKDWLRFRLTSLLTPSFVKRWQARRFVKAAFEK